MPLIDGPLRWESIDLVIFDVDGTLYDQRRLRIRMAMKILGAAFRARSLTLPRTIHAFRQCREELGTVPVANFLDLQYELTAAHVGSRTEDVRRLVSEWIELKPLPIIKSCRYPGVEELFGVLASANKLIAVFSDYPAQAKLTALGLKADIIVSATDVDIGRLKPDPTGLHKILKHSGTSPQRALMIGDRPDRDGEAARLAGVRALIRSRKPHEVFDTFRSFREIMLGLEMPAGEMRHDTT
jgi:phosphoglycolate phosphatase